MNNVRLKFHHSYICTHRTRPLMFVWPIFSNIIYTFLVNRVYTYFIKTKKIT
jgi:hypothetical protein